MTAIEIRTRTIEEKGIVLPWERTERYGCDLLYPTGHAREGEVMYPDRKPTGTVIETGEVFVPLQTLYDLADQDVWDSQFGSAFLLSNQEGLALVGHGLAEQETKGGYHRTQKLLEFLEGLEADQI